MNVTMDNNAARSSIASFTLVAAIHLALLAGLIYGLKTVSLTLPHERGVIVMPLPPEPVKPVDTTENTRIPVDFVPIPFHETPTPPPITTTVIDNWPPVIVDPVPITPGGTVRPVPIAKPADIFNAALVDAKSCDKPEYPRNSLRNGDTGVVTLELMIGLDGKVGESKVIKSSGHRELDQAAVAGLSLCKFKPATLNGQTQKSWAKLQYAWSLDS